MKKNLKLAPKKVIKSCGYNEISANVAEKIYEKERQNTAVVPMLFQLYITIE